MPPGTITVLLDRWRNGDASAIGELTPLVYDQLKIAAGSYVGRGLAEPGYQATELVNQLFLELLNGQQARLSDRRHFFIFSARIMRNILADHARAAKAAKRGGELKHSPLNAELLWVGPASDPEILDLEGALAELEEFDAGKVRAIELRYFFGFTAAETAEVLEVSKPTVDRDIRFALAWLNQRLHPKA